MKVTTRTIGRTALLGAFGALVAGSTIALAAPAHADTLDAVAARYEYAICGTLDAYPSVAGVTGVLMAIEQDGWSAYDSGGIVARAVYVYCPRHSYELGQFVASVGTSSSSASRKTVA